MILWNNRTWVGLKKYAGILGSPKTLEFKFSWKVFLISADNGKVICPNCSFKPNPEISIVATTDDGPKKQHILPKVYLKHFLNEDDQIFSCKIKDELKSKKIKSTGLGEIAYKNQFYNLTEGILNDISDDKDELFVETQVNQHYEKKIAKYWPLFQNRVRILTIDDKHQIASIILHLKLRNEFIRNLVFNQRNLPELVSNSIVELREMSQNDRGALKNIDQYYELLYDVLLSHFQELGPAGMHNTFLVNSLYGEVTFTT